jgi:tetratricopeptide (TPR) repeat protein
MSAMDPEQNLPEPTPAEQHLAVDPATDVPSASPSSGLPQKTRAAIVLAAGLIVLPVLYLAFSHGSVTTVQSARQQAPATDISSLETLVKTSPTIVNRINLSLAYINGGESARSIPVLLSVVAEDKTNTIAWNDLCVANTLQKSYDAAIEDCETAIRYEPNYTLARNNLKWAQDEKNKALGIKPPPGSRDATFYLNDGLKQLNLGFYDQAIASWQHTLELDPGSALAVNNIGTAYMMKKQPDEAIVYFNKAIAMDPTLQLAKNNLAWAHSEQKTR